MQSSPSLSTAVLLLLRLPLFLTTTTTTTTITHVQAQTLPRTPAPTPTPTPTPPTTGPYNPTPLYSVHSVFIEGGALYVHGGLPSTNSTPSGQTFALDLSVSWKTSQPAFKQLSTGFPSSSITSALMEDKDAWIMTNGDQFVFYHIEKDVWNNPATLTELNPKPGFPAVTDMSTGVIYFVNGFVVSSVSATAAGTIPMMMTLRRSINGMYEFSSMGTSTEFSLVDSGYASCWSTLRKSILLHGGLGGSPIAIYQKTLYEFNTIKSAFTTVNDNGDIPTARSGHCMVEAYNGSKIVLFGGVDETSAGLSDIYFLDVATLKWTAGKTGGAGVGRAYAACAVTSDRFVAWGGATKVNGDFVAMAATSATVVYDFIQNKWITTFSPARTNITSPNPDPDPSTPPTPPAGEEASPSSSKGALIGGIAGGVVVLAAIAVFIFFCRRRSARRKEKRGKKMSFSTFAAMPVVTARTGPSADDSLPDQQHQQQQRSNTRETEKNNNEEQDESEKEKKPQDDDNDGITYVVGARAMPASPTESSFRISGIIPQNRNYQQLQQLPPTQQPPLQQPPQPLQPLSPIQEQQQAYHSSSGISFPPPPATAANASTGYTVPVLKFFNPTANTPTTTPSANTPILIPSSPVASVIPLPPPSTPQRPQSLIPGGFIAPRVVHPLSSSQPKEPSYTTLIPYFSPVASVSSLPTISQHSQSTIPINNSNNRAYTNDQYHDQQGKEELQQQQQQQRPPPTVEYGPNSSPALSYLATSSQWTGSHGSTPVVPPPTPGAGSNPYSTFSPSPLSGAPTGPAPAGGNAFAAFTPSLLSCSDSTEGRNSLPFVPVIGSGTGGGDPQKTGDLAPPITPPRNPHGTQ